MSKEDQHVEEQEQEHLQESGRRQNAAAEEQEEDGSQPDDSQLQADLERFRDLALRTQADFENYRKRTAREREEAVRYANAQFLERLVPVLDNFQLGLEAAKKESEDSPILAGMDMVARQLEEFLASCGVEVIDATGADFDPQIHDAIAHEHSAEVPDGRVLQQVRRGYKLKDRLIRPANVVVSRGNDPAAADAS